MGRPKSDIDFEAVDKYLQAQCSGSAIAGLLGVCPDTLYRAVEQRYKVTFSAYLQQKRGEGREILRMKLWEEAVSKGNTIMLIWLSKNYLGMSENIERLSDEAIEQIITRLKAQYHE